MFPCRTALSTNPLTVLNPYEDLSGWEDREATTIAKRRKLDALHEEAMKDKREVRVMRTMQTVIDVLEDFGPSSAEYARREKERRVAVAKLRRQNAMNLLRIKPVAKRGASLPAIEPREHGDQLVYETKKYGTTVTLPWLSILG